MERHGILVVVVVYNQEINKCDTFRSLLFELSDVFVYDNSLVSGLNREIAEERGWTYFHNPENPGLSVAYNTAAQYAKEHHFCWLLICDQDTVFPHGYYNHCVSYSSSKLEVPLFAPIVMGRESVISPARSVCHMICKSKETPTGVCYLSKYAVINSGMLINVCAFLQVGGYNENVALDYSDYQFVDRLRQKYKMFYIMPDVCVQNFSNDCHNDEQKLARFKLFCSSLKNCESVRWHYKVDYFLIVVKRTVSLVFHTKSLRPIRIFYKDYLK